MQRSFTTWLRGFFYRFFENPLIRRVVKNSGYLFSATGVSAALSLFQGMLIARMLDAGELGILAAIITFTSVVNKLASFRMGELVIKYVGHFAETDQPQQAAAVFKAAALLEMLASLVAYGLIWLLAPLGSRYFAHDTSLTHLFLLYGLIVLANLISESSTGLLQIFDRYRRMASLSVVQSLATLAIVALAYVRQGGLAEILAAYMVGKMIGALSLTAAALVEAGRRWGADWWRTSLSSLRSHFRPLAVFAISTNLSASLSLINKDSESLWITFFRATEEAGFYKQALALVNLVQMPVSPLPQATYPELSREVARKNWKNIRYILRQGSLLAGGFTVTASLVLFFFGKPIIRLLYTEEYLPAYPALLILLVGFLFANTFYWNRTALLALGRPDFPTKVNSVLAVMKIAGFLLFVPRYGYLASAALLSASYVLGTSISAIKVYSLISTQERVIEQGEASIQRVIR